MARVEFPRDLCRSAPLGSIEIPDADRTYRFDSVRKIIAYRDRGDTCRLEVVLDADADAPDRPRVDRKDLLRELNDGEPVELTIDFRAFQQVEGVQNRNHLRFKKGILRKLARSFKGQPFLRDHNDRQLEARGGTVTGSKAVEIDGGLAFDMTAQVTAPWAVAAILQGNLDRFSIGWQHGGLDTILCSHNNKPIFTECFHFPGDKLEDDDGNVTGVAEFVFTEAEGEEVSGVTVPAVAGTGISDVRAALSAVACAANTQEDPPMTLDSIREALGLSAEADEKTIAAAAEAQAKALATATERVSELDEQVAKLADRVDATEQSNRERAIDGLFTEFANRLPRDEASRDELKDSITVVAESDLEGAKRILAAMPLQNPVGTPLQSAPDYDPTTRATKAAPLPSGVPWSKEIESQIDQLGMTRAEYAMFAPREGHEFDLFKIRKQLKRARDRKARAELFGLEVK